LALSRQPIPASYFQAVTDSPGEAENLQFQVNAERKFRAFADLF
jgi:hypothetical protein